MRILCREKWDSSDPMVDAFFAERGAYIPWEAEIRRMEAPPTRMGQPHEVVSIISDMELLEPIAITNRALIRGLLRISAGDCIWFRSSDGVSSPTIETRLIRARIAVEMLTSETSIPNSLATARWSL